MGFITLARLFFTGFGIGLFSPLLGRQRSQKLIYSLHGVSAISTFNLRMSKGDSLFKWHLFDIFLLVDQKPQIS